MNTSTPAWLPPTKPRRRGRRIALIIAVAVLAVFVLAGIITAATEGNDGINPAASSSSATRAPAPRDDTYAQPPVNTTTVTVTASPITPPKPTQPRAYTTDGKYKVGPEIAAGEYSYVVTDYVGYYATCHDITCDPIDGGMIDNNLMTEQGSTGYLEIPATATYVELQGLTLTPAAP